MKRALGWMGRGCVVAGVLLIAANIAMHLMGLSASYNIGDASKFEFILISFWHLGAIIVGVGALTLVIAGRV
jgi:hypothetical protein